MQHAAPSINFRPWRAERRQDLTQQLIVAIFVVGLIGVGILVSAGFGVNQLKANQESRNQYIEAETRRLNNDLKEIKSLRAQRAKMIERMRIIEGLQGNRPVIVRVFDEMVRILPDDTFFDSLSSKSELIEIRGVAGSNNKVSMLMRNVDDSEWFDNPNLTGINAAKNYGEYASNFNMTFDLVLPNRGVEDESSPKK